MVWVYGGATLAVVCCIWAFLRGGPVERIGAAIILPAWFLSLLLHSPSPDGPGIWVLLIDIATLFAFLWLSIWSRRVWTVLASACQLAAVASHFGAMLGHFGAWIYITAIGIWGGEGLLLALVIGIIGYRASERRARLAGAVE